MRRLGPLFGFVVVSVSLLLAQTHPDAKGCKDSPIISRFPGSYIASCKDAAFDTYKMPVGGGNSKSPEGEYHEVHYQAPKGHTMIEVSRNISNALRAAGFTIDWEDSGHSRLTAHKGGTWIYEYVNGQGDVAQYVIIEKQMQQQMVASATDVTNALNSTGHIVANGILFDTGKADLKPESSAALDEIAKALKQDPGLKIFVVGHTDNVGAVAGNMELSRQRAAAVVAALTTRYGVAASRLGSFGAGPYAPVGSNDTEEGRALNRRVELVKQ